MLQTIEENLTGVLAESGLYGKVVCFGGTLFQISIWGFDGEDQLTLRRVLSRSAIETSKTDIVFDTITDMKGRLTDAIGSARENEASRV